MKEIVDSRSVQTHRSDVCVDVWSVVIGIMNECCRNGVQADEYPLELKRSKRNSEIESGISYLDGNSVKSDSMSKYKTVQS